MENRNVTMQPILLMLVYKQNYTPIIDAKKTVLHPVTNRYTPSSDVPVFLCPTSGLSPSTSKLTHFTAARLV